jgi:hypothetical protein
VLRREERTGGARNIGLPHEAFPYQESRHASALELGEVRGGIEATFGDHDAIPGDFWRKPLTHRERRFECPQIAVIDPDEPRLQLEGARELNFIMNFKEGIHSACKRYVLDIACGGIINGCNDDEDAVGAKDT